MSSDRHQMHAASSLPRPELRFYRFYPDTPMPRRGDQSAAGTLPTRAFRYCEAVRLASGWGYWLFPPLSFSVFWDGTEIRWRALGSEAEWEPLQDRAHFPGFPEAWDAVCPGGFRGVCPPFLTALPEPGLLQITLGVIPVMNPGWLMYLRPVANVPGTARAEPYAGMVDPEAYRCGPLFANVRLSATGQPITFQADRPLVQVSAVPRWALAEAMMPEVASAPGLDEWDDAVWDGYYRTVVEPNTRPDRAFGAYAARARGLVRGGCPFSGERAAV